MSLNTQRLNQRSLTLKDCFHKKAMLNAWQKIVKEGMRNQPLVDLHDYYDFHRNREVLIPIISEQIIKGNYKPKPSHIIRTEKKYGICRHLQLPSPDDAVILQTLVEKISPIIIASQPSDRAYYSRSHKQPKSESDIDENFPYEWWELWPKFQSEIYKFSETFNYVVVTDISNYFDNISFKILRNVISSYGKFEEELLDFLFFMLESLVWRPDYLPLSGFGLPQVNFDAPRLFGHCFLFEIDQYLKKETNNNFVRWMDDIDFGCNEIHHAKTILSNLDELLLTRGLRLNMSKTKILSSQEAKKFFLPDENRYLTIINKLIDEKGKNGKDINDYKKRIKKRFKRFLNLSSSGRWTKVYKRYFTISAKTQDTFLEAYVPDTLLNQPELRDKIFTYYKELGYNNKRFQQIKKFFLSEECMCDIAVFSTARLIVDWIIPIKSTNIKQIVAIANEKIKKVNSGASFIASLWLIAKYGTHNDLFSLLWTYRAVWENSSFLSRQVAAVMPLLKENPEYAEKIEKMFIETGHLESIRLLKNLEVLRIQKDISTDLTLYLTQKNKGVYPLSKFLILLNILTNSQINVETRKTLIARLINEKIITDFVYLKKLNKINNYL